MSGMPASWFTPSVQDGIVLLVTLEEGRRGWHIEEVRFAPTWVTPCSWIVRLVGPALDARRLPVWQLAELRRSWDRTLGAVDAPDGIRPYRRATVR